MRSETIANKYNLLQPLGSGGTAEVYLAEQTGLAGFRKLVVIKRLSSARASDPAARDLFLHEARTAASLRHPNVVDIYEVGIDEDTLYIAMEYLEGVDVRRLIRAAQDAGEPVSFGHALTIVGDAAAGLHYAHGMVTGEASRGVVHRDVKPENLFVTFAGITKVLDFGIATALGGEQPAADRKLRGTIPYMSPEQAGAEPVDHRSDVYSLAVVLFELTTLQRPFDADSRSDLLRAIIGDEPPRAGDIVPGYPDCLGDLLDRALTKDLGGRLPSCEQLGVQLQACAGDLGLLTDRSGLAGHLRQRFGVEQPSVIASHSTATLDSPIDGQRPPTSSVARSAAASRGPMTNLVADPEPFVGRASDLQAIEELMAGVERLITVVGPGGAGKTRVARHLGGRAVARRAYQQVYWVDLGAARSLFDIADAVGAALNIPAPTRATGEAAVAALSHTLVGRGDLLLILDNFEQIASHSSESVGVWLEQCPRCQFVVTSRERLRLSRECAYELGPMQLPTSDHDVEDSDAVVLFVRRAAHARPDYALTSADALVVAEIVRQLDGLPLAIELAAARMNVFSPQQLLDRLSERLQVLVDANRDAGGRQRTMRSTIDWSWNLLEPAEQMALAQASVFRGGFSLEAAEAVALSGEGPASTADLIQTLRDKSLLRRVDDRRTPDVPRFVMYESVRAYGAERLRESQFEGQTLARLAAFYGARAREWVASIQRDGTSSGPIEVERDNLIVAALWADSPVASGDPAVTDLRIAIALALHQLYLLRGPLPVTLERLNRALHGDGSTADPTLWGRALEARGEALRATGNPDGARRDFEAALHIARLTAERSLEARVLRYLGMLLQLDGRIDQARDRYHRALELHREMDNPRGEALTLGSLGVLQLERGDLDEATASYQEAIELSRRIGDVQSEGSYLTNLGAIEQLRQNAAAARRHYEAALAIHHGCGNLRREGMVLGYLGSLAHDQGQVSEATIQYELAESALREVGDRRFEGMFIGYRAIAAHEAGDHNRAQRYYTRALRILGDVGDRRLEGMFLGFASGLRAEQEELDEAEEGLQRGEALLESVSDSVLLETVRLNRCHLDLARGRRAQQTGDAARAARWRAEAEDRLRHAKAPDPSGQPPLAAQSDDVRHALRLGERALAAATQGA